MVRPTNPRPDHRLVSVRPVDPTNPEAAAQVVPMLLAPKGIDRYHSSTRVGAEHAVKIRNFMFDDGVLVSRRGTGLMGGVGASEVVQVVDFIRQGIKKVTIRFCTRHLEMFEYGTGTWRSFPVALTGSTRDFFAYTGWADKLLFSNGVDGLWEFDLTTLVIKRVPNAPGAKHLSTFGNRVVASAVIVNGTFFPVRVQWSTKNDYTKWDKVNDIGSGDEDLFGSPGGVTDEAMGVFPIDDTNAILVRSRSLYQMSLSGNVQAPFRFDRVVADVGSPFRNSIVSAPSGIIFASRDNIHLYDSQGHKPIGDLVIDEILDEVGSLRAAYATFDVGRSEYRLACDNLVWRYRFIEEGWTADEYSYDIRALSRQIQGKVGFPIDSLLGIIDNLPLTYPPPPVSIDDLVIWREDDNSMMFVPMVGTVVTRENNSMTDVLTTGEVTPVEILLETGVINSDAFSACELHEIHLEYESDSEQQLLFEATFNDGETFQPVSFKNIEETFGSEIIFVKTERVSRKLQLRLRSLTLGTLRILGIAPLIVKVNRHMASKKPRVASIEVLPTPLTMQVGSTQQLNIILRGQNGQVLPGLSYTILTSDKTIATVSSTGLVRAIAAGSFAIVVSAGNTQVSVSGTVSGSIQAAVAIVVVNPASSQGEVGTGQLFTATLRDANGNVLMGRTLTWGSSNNAVATAMNGAVDLLSEGTVVISATSEGVTGGATLTVLASVASVDTVLITPASFSQKVGDMLQLTAVLQDASDNVLSGKVVTWVSSNPAIAAVSTTGLVTMLGVGSVTITATSETVDGTSIGTISAALAPVALVSVTPTGFSLVPGATQALTVVLKDTAGNVLTGRTVTYSSSNTSIATVSSIGLVTAVAQGIVVISATSEGKIGQSSGTVTAALVASVSVNPSVFSLAVGATIQLSATPRDASGNALTGRSVVWGTSDPTKATVDLSGLVTAVAAGSATITATCETKTGSSAGTLTATVGGTFPAIGATLPIGLVHSRDTDLISGEVFPTGVDAGFLVGGTSAVVTLTDTGNALTNFTNLQNAINAATRGTTIVVPNLSDMNGVLTRLELPAKAGTDWIYIISAAVYSGTFPRGADQTVQDSDESVMPMVRTSNTLGVMSAAPNANASYYRFIGIRFVTDASDCTDFAVNLGNHDPAIQVSNAATPHHLILDRCVVRPNPGSIGGQGGVGLDCKYGSVRGCRIKGWRSLVKTDSNAISMSNGAGPFFISHNYLHSLGETIMFGGALDNAASDMMPSDILVRHNEVTAPLTQNPYHPSFDGQVYNGRKNIVESKGSRRVLIEYNRFSHSWISAQSGQGMMTYAINQTNTAPWIVNEDWTLRYNEWDDINTFFHTATRGFYNTAAGTRRFHVANNVVKNLNGPYSGPGIARGFIFLRDLQTGLLPGFAQMVFLNNTIVCQDANRTGLTMIELGGPPIAEGGQPHTGLVFRDNIIGNSDYLIFSSVGQGSAGIAAHAPDMIFASNVIVEWASGDFSTSHPAGNAYVNSLAAVDFMNASLENFELAATSPFKGTDTNGKDPGVNFTLLNSQLALI